MAMDKDTIAWTKFSPTATRNEYGQKVVSVLSGWPKNILGNHQVASASSHRTVGGIKVKFDAVIYSESFGTGAVGDSVSFGGVTYICVSAYANTKHRSSAVDHYVYHLVRFVSPV